MVLDGSSSMRVKISYDNYAHLKINRVGCTIAIPGVALGIGIGTSSIL